MFADMDENLSWLFDVNSAGVTTTAPDFEESNVMRCKSLQKLVREMYRDFFQLKKN